MIGFDTFVIIYLVHRTIELYKKKNFLEKFSPEEYRYRTQKVLNKIINSKIIFESKKV